MTHIFRANGKLLLSGEYFVLEGAAALALPTKLGQTLEVEEVAAAFPNFTPVLHWHSLDHEHQTWFEATFALPTLDIMQQTNEATANRLQKLLRTATQLNPAFLSPTIGYRVTTRLEFPRAWGLGTSSTISHLIAQWSHTDPYALNASTFGGSGYDIACAAATQPIIYQLREGHPHVEITTFRPSFRNNLYFVHLGKKKDSREAIKHFRELPEFERMIAAPQVSAFTMLMKNAPSLRSFQSVVEEHERLVSRTLRIPRAQILHFPDYWGSIKSLGAWGGDFVLATSDRSTERTRYYFTSRGFDTVLGFTDLFAF